MLINQISVLILGHLKNTALTSVGVGQGDGGRASDGCRWGGLPGRDCRGTGEKERDRGIWQRELVWWSQGPQGAGIHSSNLGCFKGSAFLSSFGFRSPAFSSGLDCKSLALTLDIKQDSNTGMCGKGLGVAQQCK